MNWFKKLVVKWVREDWESVRQSKENYPSLAISSSKDGDSLDSEPVLNFKIYSAVGGRIVEFRHYDRQKDRSFNQTYIITSDQDFGERIAKIATMEALKQ